MAEAGGFVQLEFGYDVIRSYRRLSYTPWHALAEFIDNSTQSYFSHRAELDDAYASEGEGLLVSVVYERDAPDGGLIRIADNAMGMSLTELQRALHVGLPPEDATGRCRYGMGLKTAACWFGQLWSVRTKKRGESVEHEITVDVERIAEGHNELPYEARGDRPAKDHYTVVEIRRLNRHLHGRTLGKIRNFLSSMYRQDFRDGALRLEWQNAPLTWGDDDSRLLTARDGSQYKKTFDFAVNDKRVHGWVGILERGSRAMAGFSILHANRVVKGWPESWRPTTLFGQEEGSNDLINQRLVGEVHLDDFDVSHTKDDIQWMGDELDKVEDGLKASCGDYASVARTHRKRAREEGPSEADTAAAVDELTRELESPEMVDTLTVVALPPPEVVENSFKEVVGQVGAREETFRARIGNALRIRGYLENLSVNDPYVVNDCPDPSQLVVIINMAHPQWSQLHGADGVLNYLRHCTYDAVAEWHASQMAAALDANTIKLLKDKLLRIPFEMEMHGASGAEAATA